MFKNQSVFFLGILYSFIFVIILVHVGLRFEFDIGGLRFQSV